MRSKRGQGIVHVADLFKKYRDTLRAPQGSVVAAFTETVQELLNITLSPKDCGYVPSSRTLQLRTSGMLKTEILLKKAEVLERMELKLGKKSAPREIL